MISGMFRDLLDWFAGLAEALGVLAVILLVGLVVGMTGFWIVVRGLRKIAGTPPELDPSEEDDLVEDSDGQPVWAKQEEDSPPREH